MAFTTSSKYATLTPYMLMEFMYADTPTPETYPVNTGSTTVGYNKMVNGYLDNDIQIFNPLVDRNITNNTTENSVVKINQNNYVTLDSNLVIPFNDFDSKLTSTAELPIVFPSNLSVVYDTVKLHLRAGYNLDNLDGVIVSIKYEDSDGSYVTVLSTLIKKGTQQVYTLNTNPVTIGMNIYDKYVELKIPNLLDMQNKYLAATDSNKPLTLAGLISKSGKGFNAISPLRISVDEVNSISDYNGYEKYGTSNFSTLSLEQENPFKNIGALIRPSDSGEFFEYFAIDNGGFIEDFILFQNSIGNSYYIYHQIEVIEQIGAAFIETSNFSNMQTTAYDVPNLFRPIIRNSSVASSFMLRYTMSLVNNKDQTSIIRISNYTSANPGKYGTRITPLQISENPVTHKIYNKVYDQPAIQLNQIVEESVTKEIVKYANVFIQQTDVTTSIDNLITKSANTSDSEEVTLEVEVNENSGVIYGKGKGIIKISPFDNYFKFTFYTEGSDGIPDRLDLESSGDYKLIFIDNKGKKIAIPSLVSKNIANPAKGEIAFLVEEIISEKILNFNNENYYISNMPVSDELPEMTEYQKGELRRTDLAEFESPSGLSKISSAKFEVSSNSDGISAVSKSKARQLSLASEVSEIRSPFKKKPKKQIIKSGSSSVLYRGLWRPDNDNNTELKVKGKILDGRLSKFDRLSRVSLNITDSKIRNVIPGLSQSFVSRRPSVLSITPTSVNSTDKFAPVNIPNTITTNPTGALSGSSLISAVAALIEAFNTSGWTSLQIYNYFMVPGNVGYITYPNLTAADFESAATGILSSSDIEALIIKGGARNTNPSNIGGGKIGFKIL